MINRLRIQNFQSHQDTELIFHPGVNVIIGSSDHGKSAVIRALYWACHNKPSGDGFRSWWGGDTEVTVEFPDGRVTRLKSGKTKNQYILLTGANVETFNSFNQTVPEEIQALVNMDDLNWHLQMGTPFLLSERPGEVARYLNRIVNLDVIDRTVSNINRRLRQVQQDTRSRKQQIKEYEEELQSADFELIPDLERDLVFLKKQRIEVGELDQDIGDLKGIMADVAEHQTKLDSLPDIDIDKARKDLARIQELIDQEKEVEEDRYNLETLIGYIERHEKSIELLTDQIETDEQEYVSQIGDRCPLCDQEIK